MKAKLRNACLVLAALGCIASGAVLALDNTINNDFWDTRSYVNASPNEQTGTFTEALDGRTVSSTPAAFQSSETVDTFLSTSKESNNLARLFTLPRALTIYIR